MDTAVDAEQTQPQQETDIFAWANNLFLYKDQLQIELFIMSKQYVLYRARFEQALTKQIHPLLIDGMLEYIITGAGQGLVVRGFDEAESEENVLQRLDVAQVEKLTEAMTWLGAQESDMEQFVVEDHDPKRIKGLIARCSHPEMPEPFYVIKMLTPANFLKGMGAWLAAGNRFSALDQGAVLRVPADNQLLIVGKELYVFNQSKLERMFGYNAKKHAIAQKKVRQIEANFKLSFADDTNLQMLVKENKAAITKLQKIDPSSVKQEELLSHAEELGVELMTDEDGAIIIMSNGDLTKFVNLLNDDYVESALTGHRYEIKSKKLLKPTEETV